MALVATSAASAAFQPIERRHGEVEIPRVRAGTITIPDAHRSGRVTVILTLADPPLAAYSRTLAGSSGTRRLNVQSRGAKAYTAQLQRAQRAAAASLKRAIPAATVKRNYTLLLNGIAVELPATELAKAAKLSFTRKLYPSYRYTLALNRSPGLIGADALAAAGGGSGEGMKIAVIDDGIDPKNRFFNPQGYSYPAGFPKGGTKWTSPKVIVARSFVGDGRGRADARWPSTRRTRSTARTWPGSPRATRARPRRPAATIRRRRGSPGSRRARTSATTASSTSRRRSATSATRRRSSPPSRRPSGTGWT